jgi:hypothetical protein
MRCPVVRRPVVLFQLSVVPWSFSGRRLQATALGRIVALFEETACHPSLYAGLRPLCRKNESVVCEEGRSPLLNFRGADRAAGADTVEPELAPAGRWTHGGYGLVVRRFPVPAIMIPRRSYVALYMSRCGQLRTSRSDHLMASHLARLVFAVWVKVSIWDKCNRER